MDNLTCFMTNPVKILLGFEASHFIQEKITKNFVLRNVLPPLYLAKLLSERSLGKY